MRELLCAVVVSQLSREMYIAEERYYQIARLTLQILGLWPYQQSYFALIQKVLFTVTLTTYIIAQLLVFATTEYSLSLLFKILSSVFPVIYVMMKYYLFVIQADNVKKILHQIHNDYSSLDDKLEIDIINKYARNTWFFSVSTMTFCVFAIIICALFEHLPIILDVISPLNESRPRQLIVATEYFVNEEKYFYPLLIHEILSGSMVVITTICTAITLMIFMQHTCALFKIARYRIETVIEESALTIPNPKRKQLFYRRILNAIIIHQKAVEFLDFSISGFLRFFTILILVGVSSLCLNLLHFLLTVTLMNDIGNVIITSVFVSFHLIYMFSLNYGGQQITDHGVELFKASYNTLWYVAPLQIQKLLLFIMQRTMKNVTLTCGGIYIASLEGFATLLSTAVSYLTVIYSTR